MKRYLTALVLAFLFSTSFFYSQQTAVFTNDLAAYQDAVALYNNQQYLAAQTQFTKIKNTTKNESIEADCSYYIANAAIRLNQQSADALMEKFVEEYPTSTKRNSAFLEVGNYYFESGRYPQARKWFDKVEERNLSGPEKEKFYFYNGYAFFQTKRPSEAKKYLNRVANSKEYGSQAKYYLGYMAYEGDNYEEATQLFEEVKDKERYAEDMSYYQADMNFKLGKFQEAITLGKSQYDKSSPQEKSQLSKIIGESYFNLGEYEAAIPYLKEYKGTRGKWNNTDYYQLGYAYYKQADYANAIAEFNKIITGKDAVAQNAYYHLGESYLKQNQKQQALNAFKNASEMSFSPQIQEDAWYNYAKLSYEIGNAYTSVPQVLTSFLEKYPKTNNKSEIEDLLIDSYISSKNFKEALNLLENNKSFENKLAYQKVAFFRGLELYNESNYNEAKAFFEKSLKEPRDARFTARATYWKAESDYQLHNFEQALIGFKQFKQLPENKNTPETTNVDYNIAYTYFKTKNYTDAISSFQQFLGNANIDNQRKKDANLRLGDSYFVSSQYWPAMENYNKVIAIGGADADYAAYQKAISYGFVDRTNTKLEELTAFDKSFPNSGYRDDALYELGNTHLALNNNTDAIKTYDKLINTQPKSSYVPKALLKKGLILTNANKPSEALSVFKKVANDFPASQEALQAVSSAKFIYIDQGKVDDYAAWVKTLDFVEVADAELDQASYDAAESKYLQNDSRQAISLFEKYIKEFPSGLNNVPANFYLAQLYFSDNQKNKAISNYEFVLTMQRNEYTEQALARLSQIYLENKNYQKAIPILERLEVEADFPQNIVFAQSNLMKSYYEMKDYTKTVTNAEKVLANAKMDNQVKSDAQVFIARSAMQTNQEAKAKAAYAEVQKIATGELAAEALYYDAYFKNKEGKFAESNAAVQKLAKDYSGYKKYGAKGLIVMAKNFYALKDSFQATYILESVITNFSDLPEIVTEAKQELEIIKAQEAKTNASVDTND